MINLTPQKPKKLGKYANSINFEVKFASKNTINIKKTDTVVGTFFIDNKTQQINLRQLNEVCDGNITSIRVPDDINSFEHSWIIETFRNAKYVFWQKLKFGI